MHADASAALLVLQGKAKNVQLLNTAFSLLAALEHAEDSDASGHDAVHQAVNINLQLSAEGWDK